MVPAEHVVAWFQKSFKRVKREAPAEESQKITLKVEHVHGDSSDCTVTGVRAGGGPAQFAFVFGKDSGQLDSITFEGSENLLLESSEPAFWRAPTDNDLGGSYHKRRRMWQHASRDRMIVGNECKLINAGAASAQAAVYSSLSQLAMPATKKNKDRNVLHNTTYIVHSSGDVEVHNSIEFLGAVWTTKATTTATPKVRTTQDASREGRMKAARVKRAAQIVENRERYTVEGASEEENKGRDESDPNIERTDHQKKKKNKKKQQPKPKGYDWNAHKGCDSLPRFGFALTLPKAWSQVEWYGNGPHESYVDRRAGAAVGRYEKTVSEMFYPYVRPQENGNRVGVRWMVVSNGKYSIMAAPAGSKHREIHFSALHYTPDSLTNGTEAYHSHAGVSASSWDTELDLTMLHVDEMQAGLGGINSWGKAALEQYVPHSHTSTSYTYT